MSERHRCDIVSTSLRQSFGSGFGQVSGCCATRLAAGTRRLKATRRGDGWSQRASAQLLLEGPRQARPLRRPRRRVRLHGHRDGDPSLLGHVTPWRARPRRPEDGYRAGRRRRLRHGVRGLPPDRGRRDARRHDGVRDLASYRWRRHGVGRPPAVAGHGGGLRDRGLALGLPADLGRRGRRRVRGLTPEAGLRRGRGWLRIRGLALENAEAAGEAEAEGGLGRGRGRGWGRGRGGREADVKLGLGPAPRGRRGHHHAGVVRGEGPRPAGGLLARPQRPAHRGAVAEALTEALAVHAVDV